jgi:hypothetical protein
MYFAVSECNFVHATRIKNSENFLAEMLISLKQAPGNDEGKESL